VVSALWCNLSMCSITLRLFLWQCLPGLSSSWYPWEPMLDMSWCLATECAESSGCYCLDNVPDSQQARVVNCWPLWQIPTILNH
jgi:hypothetical protein